MNAQQKTFFLKMHRAKRSTYKEEWDFTEESWIAFWDNHPMMSEKFLGVGSSTVTRPDHNKPYSPTNFIVKPKPSRKVKPSGAKAKLSRTNRSGPAVPAYDDSRVLTVAEWKAEITK